MAYTPAETPGMRREYNGNFLLTLIDNAGMHCSTASQFIIIPLKKSAVVLVPPPLTVPKQRFGEREREREINELIKRYSLDQRCIRHGCSSTSSSSSKAIARNPKQREEESEFARRVEIDSINRYRSELADYQSRTMEFAGRRDALLKIADLKHDRA